MHQFHEIRATILPDSLLAALRYAAVLMVWLALLAIRPRLAIDIFRHRRQDSPIPRLRLAPH